MAAFVPSKADPAATAAALEKTTADKAREAEASFDGSWVAHPALVATCTEAFDAVLGDRPHQLERQRDDVSVDAAALTDLSTTDGDITLEGVRTNVAVSLAYLTAWIGGAGAVAINNLMEDAATVEISRMQIWQWVHHRASTADGTMVTPELVRELVAEEAERLSAGGAEDLRTRVIAARDVFETAALADSWPQFFTSYAYDNYLVETS